MNSLQENVYNAEILLSVLSFQAGGITSGLNVKVTRQADSSFHVTMHHRFKFHGDTRAINQSLCYAQEIQYKNIKHSLRKYFQRIMIYIVLAQI